MRDELRDITARLRTAGAMLRGLSDGQVIGVIAEAAGRLGARVDELAREIETEAGRPPGSVREGLAHCLAELRRHRLEAWLSAERPAGSARGPGLLVHVLAGDVPQPALQAIAAGLLARAGHLVKPGNRGTVAARAMAAAVAEVEPELSGTPAVVRWDGGRRELGGAAFADADVVVVHGSDEGVAGVRAASPGRARVLGHPHRFSLAVVDARGADEAWLGDRARLVAVDVRTYDLGGCLSPAGVLVCGGTERVLRFGELLAGALQESFATAAVDSGADVPWQRPAEDAAVIGASREQAGFAGSPQAPVRVLTPADGADLRWTVVVQGRALRPWVVFPRVGNVLGIAGPEEIAGLLGRAARAWSCAGLACPEERRAEWLAASAACDGGGPQRICPVGRMQFPPITWRQDGRPALGDLFLAEDMEWGSARTHP